MMRAMHATGVQLQSLQPQEQEQPVTFADRLGQWHLSRVSESHRRQLGQYFTPIEVARFMARLVRPTTKHLRVLEPGAGTGILVCALCESLVAAKTPVQSVALEAYEADEALAHCLRQSLQCAQAWLRKRGVSLEFKICHEDFALRHARILSGALLPFHDAPTGDGFDLVIANPPYFKLAKEDSRAIAAAEIVSGQPNIYAVFMALSAELLREGGELIFITPRSYTAGPYFQQFREHFFARVRPMALHLFDSRRAAFSRDEVLQESLILHGRKSNERATDGKVSISWSSGTHDLPNAPQRRVALAATLDWATKEKMLRIPLVDEDDDIAAQVRSWTGSLQKYGLKISTGPVVPFRALPLIHQAGEVPQTHAPLLWMQNVVAMKVEWPVTAKNKAQYLSLAEPAQSLLVKNRNYVLLRRFSAKEAVRRMVAAPYLAETLPGEWLGVENHLNYLYRVTGEFSEAEIYGLAGLLNSALLDRYFRLFNGNTQVSATELRAMPLPDWQLIVQLGQRLLEEGWELDAIDRWVEMLIDEFCAYRGMRERLKSIAA